MAASFTPRVLHDAAVSPREPQVVVEAFLAALAAPDLERAAGLLDESVLYLNVGLPAVHGRRATMKVLRPLQRLVSLEVYLHAVAADGSTVLTERTDVLVVGRARFQFWVNGRFEVENGLITLWRESFDYLDVLRAVGRGLVGALVPALRPARPRSASTQPGRH